MGMNKELISDLPSGGGGGALPGGAGGLMGLWSAIKMIGQEDRPAYDMKRVQRLRSLSMEQLAEEPDSMEKQVAMQEKEVLSRPGALPDLLQRKVVEGDKLDPNYYSYSLGGPIEKLKSILVKDPSLQGKGDQHWSSQDPNVASWARVQELDPELLMAIEIQKSKSYKDEGEKKAIEALIKHAVEGGYKKLGVAGANSVKRIEQLRGEMPGWLEERYSDKYPKIISDYLKQEPEFKFRDLPQYKNPWENIPLNPSDKKLNENIDALRDKKTDIYRNTREMLKPYQGIEYTPYDPNEPPSGQEKNEPRVLNPGLDFDYVRNNIGLPRNVLNKAYEVENELRDLNVKQRGLERNKIRNKTLKEEEKNSALRYREPNVGYHEFDLEKFNQMLNEGYSPWQYFTDDDKKK